MSIFNTLLTFQTKVMCLRDIKMHSAKTTVFPCAYDLMIQLSFDYEYVQTMTTFMPPPPAATFLAFHPQDNNIIAIGMDDSTIQIYNVRVDEVIDKCLSRFIYRQPY